jgi:REP element-mobilizing transposase RayT
MPDPLHFLAAANSSAADLTPFLSAFKQRTGYRYLKENCSKLWQPRYYEHILRAAEDFGSVAV